jgi:hypothetical protein
MITVILLGLSIALNVVCVVGIVRALRHKEQYDDFFEETQNRIRKIIHTMKDIDIRGSFESDDEVGTVFQQMKTLIESLDVFIFGRLDDETTSPPTQ